MKISKAESRDKKRSKKNKMRVTGRSVFLIQEVINKKAEKARTKAKKNRKSVEGDSNE